MEKILILMLVSIISFQCNSQTDFKELNQRNGKFYRVNSSSPFTGKVVTKRQKRYGSNEMIIYDKGYIKNGFYEGEIKDYYSNGQVKKFVTYANGKKNGVLKEYANNGQKIFVANYKNGILNGSLDRYDNRGLHLLTETYKNGILNGYYVKYDLYGNQYARGTYLNNKKSGKWYEIVNKRNVMQYYNDYGVLHGKYECRYYTTAYPQWIDGVKAKREYITRGQHSNGKKSGVWKTTELSGHTRVIREIDYDKDPKDLFKGIWQVTDNKLKKTYKAKYENGKLYIKGQGKSTFKFIADYKVKLKGDYLVIGKLSYRFGMLTKNEYVLSSGRYKAKRIQ